MHDATHACAAPCAAQVAVHLGMMDDARKLYASSERYDLLCKLYQASVWCAWTKRVPSI